jgi:hypothetical protein
VLRRLDLNQDSGRARLTTLRSVLRLRDPAIKAFRGWILAAANEPLASIETPFRQNHLAGSPRRRTRSDTQRSDR